MNSADNRRRQLRARRGIASGMLVLGLGVMLGLIAITINVSRLRQVHTQLRSACEAAALAGAAELLDESQLYGTSDQQGDTLAARLQAQTIAAQHAIDGQPLSLDLNLDNAPAGDIQVGCVTHPELLQQPFVPAAQSKAPCNAIVVNGSRHQARGNPVAMWLGGLFGVPTANVSCEARAVIDRRIVGFRPKGLTAVPIMPCLLDAQAWLAQRAQQPTQYTDRFTINQYTNEVVQGGDGIVELEFRCPIGGGTSTVTTTNGNYLAGPWALLPAGDNQTDYATIERQCSGGLTANDLADYGGELVVPWGNPLAVEALRRADPNFGDTLWTILGQRRVWALCSTGANSENSTDSTATGGLSRWSILDFTAGAVVDAWVDRSVQPNQLVIFVQPTLLATSTAVTDSQATENNSIAKLQLSQ